MARNLVETINAEEKKKLIRRVMDEYHNVRSDWSAWLDMIPEWMAQYRGLVKPKVDPWPGCSNLHIPLTMASVEAYHGKIVATLDAPSLNLFHLVPTETGDVRRTDTLSKWVNWAFQRNMRAIPALERAAHGGIINGMQQAVMLWRKQVRKLREAHRAPLDSLPPAFKPSDVAAIHFGPAMVEATNRTEFDCFVRFHENGRTRDCELHVLMEDEREDPSDEEVEYEVEHDKVVWNAPKLEIPAPGDLLGSPDGDDLAHGTFHFHRSWLSLEDVHDYKRQNYYRLSNERLGKLRTALERGGVSGDTYDSSALRDLVGDMAGIALTTSKRRSRFMLIMAYLRYDLDHDGYAEEIIVHNIIAPNGEWWVVRIERLDTVCPDGERPFLSFEFQYIDHEPIAFGIVDVLAAIQAAANTEYNQRYDRNSVRTNPFFTYDPMSGISPGTLRLRPGTGVPAVGVQFPSWNTDAPNPYAAQELWAMVERLVPINDVSMGNYTGGRPTAGGTAMLIQQAASLWKRFVVRYARFCASAGEKAWGLYAANMDARMAFRVTGSKETETITRDDLRMGYDFQVSLDTIEQNPEMAKASAVLLYQMLQANPMMQEPTAQKWLIELLLDAHKVPDKTGAVGHLNVVATTMMTPLQELALAVQGIQPAPSIKDDHEAHIQEHLAHLASEPAVEQYPVSRPLIEKHIEMHQRMLTVQQRAAQQQTLGQPAGEIMPDVGAAAGNPLANSMQGAPGRMADLQNGQGGL